MKPAIRMALFLAAAAVGPVADGMAQGYPARSVRVIIPFTAGSAVDTVARVIGQRLSDTWKQQVVNDNRVGAAGIIGTELAAKSPADGYSLYLGNDAILAVNPAMYHKLPYDSLRDFAAVTHVANIPLVLIAHPSFPVKSVKELIALARARPGDINYASGGAGSAQHIPMEMLKAMTGINIVHVPYKGIGPGFADVLGGQVPIMFAGMSNIVPYLKPGRVRAIAVGNTKRSPAQPDIPTVAESGVPGFEYAAWTGYFAPAGVTRDIIAKLHGDITQVLSKAEVRERLSNLGFELVGSTPEALSQKLKTDIVRLGKLIRDAGIRAD
jgi:tripartite-type tricarboxylate transporter receptor subunit TctC